MVMPVYRLNIPQTTIIPSTYMYVTYIISNKTTVSKIYKVTKDDILWVYYEYKITPPVPRKKSIIRKVWI